MNSLHVAIQGIIVYFSNKISSQQKSCIYKTISFEEEIHKKT